MTKERLEQLLGLGITPDEVLELFPRDQLLSTLGFDRTSDYLDEVPIVDAINYYGERSLIEFFDISDYWGAEDAYDRYGSDLLDYFGDYSYTAEWSATDYIENYGDNDYMLEVLLESYIDAETLHTKVVTTMRVEEIDKLSELLGARRSKRLALVDFMKAQKEVLIGA